MADSQLHVVVDAIGRNVNMSIDTSQWEELKSSITSGMKSVVGEVASVIGEKTSSQYESIAAAINEMSSTFAEELSDLKRVMRELGGQIDSIGKGTGTATLGGDVSSFLASIQTNTQNVSDYVTGEFKTSFAGQASDIREMKRMASTPGKFFTNDHETHKLLGELKDAIQACCPGSSIVDKTPSVAPSPTERAATGAATTGGGGGGKSSPMDRAKAFEAAMNAATASSEGMNDSLKRGRRAYRQHREDMMATIDALEGFIGHVADLQEAFFVFSKDMDFLKGTFLGTFKSMFKEAVREEVKFIKETRAAINETQGLTAETRGLQDAMTEIGKTAKATGVGRSEFQAQYLKALKSGIKDQKIALAVTTAQLNTEKQLGLEAGELTEEFVKWNNQYNMSTMQIAEMGRGMRDIARYTGLTGKELANAVKQGDNFVEVLRNAAMLSASAAKNVLEIAANAQKMGVSKQVEPLIKAMASTNNLFREASSETRAFLFQAAAQVGRVGDLMKGTVLKTKQGIKDMEKGMEMMLKKFGVESLDAIDNLSDEAKMKLNLQLKAAYGLELGEMQQSLKALKESSKTLADRLDDIRKKQQGNLTLEEKLALKEEERRLKTSKSFEMLTSLDEAAKGAKDMNAALSKFGERRKDFEGDLKAMGKSWNSSAGAARDAINEALKGVNDSLKASGKSELSIDSSEIEKALKDPAAFRELSAKLTKAEQEAATAQKAALDPMSKIEQGVRELNDTMRNFASSFLSSYMNLTGVLGVLAPLLGMMAAQQALSIARFQVLSKNLNSDEDTGIMGVLERGLGKIFGYGGKKKGGAGDVAPGAAAGSGVDAGKGVEALAKGGLGGVSNVEDDTVAGLLRQLLHCLCSPKANRIENDQFKNIGKKKKVDDAQLEQAKITRAEKKAGAAAAQEKSKASAGGDDTKSILDKIEKLKGDGPRIAKAAGIIAAVSIGIVLLGAVLIKLANMLFAKLDLDVNTVIKTAAIIGVIMAAAGLIGMALYYAQPHLEKFDKAAGKVNGMVESMWKGAKALVRLSLPLLAFATALSAFGKVVLDVLGLTPARMALIAGTWMALALGVAGIAEAVIVSGRMYAKLPVASATMDSLARPLSKAVASFGLVSLPLMAFAAIMAAFGYVVIDKFGLTPGRMFEIAATWTILAVGVGAIGYAITFSLKGWSILGASLEVIRALMPVLFRAVAAFALVSVPLIAFAGLLAAFGYIVIDKFGLTPGRMFAIAATWLILAVGVGAIGYALTFSLKGWSILGASLEVIWTLMPVLFRAVAAFALVSVPVMAFAAVLAGFGYVVIDQLGLTPGRMFQIAATWLILAVGVGAIGYALTFSLVGWSILGASLGVIWALLPVLFMAVAAFALVSAPIVAFAAILAEFGTVVIDELGLTPGRMFDIAATWLVLAVGVGAISYALIAATPGWSMLGIAYPLLILAYGLMWLGVAAFALVSMPIMALAEVIAGFGNTLDELGITPEKMKQIGEAFVSLSETIGQLCVSMLGASAQLAVLGVLSIFTSLASKFVWMGAFAFIVMIRPFQFLGYVMSKFAESVDIEGVKKAAQVCEGIAKTISTVPPVIKALTDELLPLMEPRWWGLAPSKMESALKLTTGFFQQNFAAILSFISHGIIDPIFGLGAGAEGIKLHPRDIQMAANVMSGLAQMLPAIPPVIDSLNGPIADLSNKTWFGFGSSKLQKTLRKLQNGFSESFTEILKFISYGIIDPIFGLGAGAEGVMLHPRDIQIAANIMSGLAQMLPAIPPVIDSLNGPIANLSSKTWFGFGSSKLQKTLRKLQAGFSESFTEILKFISHGIIDPIFGLGAGAEGVMLDPRDIRIAANTMKGIADMLPAISTMINTLGSGIQGILSSRQMRVKMASIEYFAGWLSNVARMMNEGFVQPVLNMFPKEGDADKALANLDHMTNMVQKMPPLIDSLGGATQKASESVSAYKIWGAYSSLSLFMWEAGFLIRNGVLGPMEHWPKDDEMTNAVARITKMDEMFKTMASAMESMAASAAAMSNVKFSTPSLGSPEGGSLTEFVSAMAQQNSDAMGMGDTGAMADTMSQQSPQITAMQSALRLVENYTRDIKDLFERSSNVIGDIQKTSEYMSMFGDLDFYENQISEKIAQSKQFVPTVQRIAEKIGKGFDFAGGKALLETIAGQKVRMNEMATGLKETEDYTKRLAEIFTMANNAVNMIKQTTNNLTQLNAIKDVEKEITAKIASGNSFMVSVLKTVEAVATNFGTNEEVKTTLMGVQAKIKAAGDTNQALVDCLKFVETIKQLQSNVLSIGQVAKDKPLGSGVPGAGAPVSIPAAKTGLSTPEPVQTASTTGAANLDVEKTILRDQATSQPPAGGNKNAVDFSNLQKAIEDNKMTNEEILGVLQSMLRLMTPRSGSNTAPAGDTSTYSRPDKPAAYYRSPVGDFNSSSGKGATNMVRVR